MNTRLFPAALCCFGVLASCQMTGILPDAGAQGPEMHLSAASCPADSGAILALTEAVNAIREAEAKTLLKPDPLLAQIAQSHACDMAMTRRLDVAGSDGTNVVDRARAAGFRTCGVVQMVSDAASPVGVIDKWMRQAAAREQLLGQSIDRIGGGLAIGADGRQYWSLVMGENCRMI